MEPVRVGLMGFGRIGRSLFRILYKRQDIRIVAISDTAEPEGLEYLLKFDTILGRFPDEVSIKEGHLYVAGTQIKMEKGAAPGDVAWGDLGVDLVIEATSRFRSREQLAGHLKAGAKRVILCSPPADAPDLTVVMGVNDDQLRPEHRIVSNGSVTAHCAAPILKILHEAFGVERAYFTTVHAYTNQQRLADVPTEDKRSGRAAAENIIPQQTNADEVLMDLLPELRGRISALAMNVPVRNGSVVDLVCWHERPISATAINEVVRTAAATERWRKYVFYEDEPVVSSDIVRTPYSSLFDSLSTMVIGDRLSKTLSWYDNGWGYSHRVVDLIARFAEIDREVSR